MEEVMREEGRETPPAPKKKRGPRLGKKKKWLVLVLVLAVAAIAAVKLLGGRESEAAVTYQETAAAKRDITRSLSSSGTLEPADSYIVNTLVSGEILSDTFEEGDLVEKDQLLYTLDSSDAATSQNQAQNSYAQAQRSYEQAVKSKYPTADMSGTVSEVYVRNGDTVSNGTQLCRIVGDNNIYMDFLFSYVSSGDFYVGQTATVFITGFAGTIAGTVEQVSQSATVSGNAAGSGRELITVRVKAVNPGLVTEDYTATATIGSYASYGSASIHVGASSTITAGASGKVSGLNLLPGDTVGEGGRICTITATMWTTPLKTPRAAWKMPGPAWKTRRTGWRITRSPRPFPAPWSPRPPRPATRWRAAPAAPCAPSMT